MPGRADPRSSSKPARPRELLALAVALRSLGRHRSDGRCATQRAEELGFDERQRLRPHDLHDGAGLGRRHARVARLERAQRPTWRCRRRRSGFVTTLVVPYRPVLAVAKQIATIDAVSNGRFTLAAAVGWLQPRVRDAAASTTRHRGAITDEYLRAMKVLWTEDEPEFSGPSRRVLGHRLRAQVRPGAARADLDRRRQRAAARPPAARARRRLDADGRRARRRAARHGAAHQGAGGRARARPRGDRLPLHDRGRAARTLRFRRSARAIARRRAHRGRRRRARPRRSRPRSQRFEEAGFTELAINFSGESASEVMEQLDWFGAEVMPLL